MQKTVYRGGIKSCSTNQGKHFHKTFIFSPLVSKRHENAYCLEYDRKYVAQKK